VSCVCATRGAGGGTKTSFLPFLSLLLHILHYLSLDGLALAVDDGVGGNDAVGRWVDVDDLELDGTHGAADQEQVALAQRAVRLQEVVLEERIEQVAAAGEGMMMMMRKERREREGDKERKDTSRISHSPSEALDGVVDGQHVDALAVRDVRAGVDADHVANAKAQVAADNLVHPHLAGRALVVHQHDADLKPCG
jgi:hypothetical protein